MGMTFVPMLHSNTIILEALFLKSHQLKKSQHMIMPKLLAQFNAGTEVVPLAAWKLVQKL